MAQLIAQYQAIANRITGGRRELLDLTISRAKPARMATSG
jgi:hypothetical protein